MRTRVFALGAVLLAAGCFGPSHETQLADEVTKAILANDMRPVEKDFNAIVRPKLEDREKVGRLSDDLNALGKYKGVHEVTPQGSPAGEHRFNVEFEKGTWVEDMKIDSEGKVAAFRVHPPAAAP